MSKPASPEAVAELRRRRPDLADIPDEGLAKLTIAHWTEFGMKRDALGEPIRRWFR